MTSSDINCDTKGVQPLATLITNDDNSNSSASPDSSTPSSPPLSSTTATTDDVTTIFVVGFPDDMREREFQNMFIFAKGFEAASLKWHCKEQADDQDLFYHPFNNLNSKKQMIGFARFHTRQEAMDAANEMNGKRVDLEKGSVLKAEMAKKNLHIKRNSIAPSSANATLNNNNTNLLSSALFLSDQTSSPLAILSRRLSQPQTQQSDILPNFSTDDPSAACLKSFSPLPSDLLSPGDYENDPFLSDPILTEPNTPSFADSFFGQRSLSFDGRNNNSSTNNITITQSRPDDIVHPYNLFSTSLKSSELDTAGPFSYLSKSTPAPNHDFAFSYGNGFLGSSDEYSLLASAGRKHSLQPSSTAERTVGNLTASFRSSPADQNPPCNTLYVGNLPPATSEDELRSLFSACEGYKRMYFRQKSQGPMCFVEFDDIAFATQAMNQHQGHVLSNSIKGGIRLSFSKNPLFIKPNKENTTSTSAFNFKQMGTALLADL
ncbi:MAG: hypothetical protein EXX96DRAFT_605699 [Benjaminiella poitrasii]|nr:MAG: hypothetical protein EXX96DRAFT_605699 [Benjaminiella poitrasii]